MTVEEALKEFLADQKARGNRPATLHWYRVTLCRLLPDDLGQPLSEFTPFLVTRALNAAASRGLRPATLANYDRALRGFCAWLLGVELITRDPMKGRRRPRVRWELKATATREELAALFRAAKHDPRHRDRFTAMLVLLVGCGLRAGEVASLKLADVDWQEGTLRVHGKTGGRLVPMNRATMKALRRYVTHGRRGQHPNVFVYGGQPIGSTTVTHVIHGLSKRAGLSRHIGAHALRHCFATEFLRNGGDVLALRRILGHSTLATTALYTHHVTEDLRDGITRFSPLAGLPLD